ncbi:MAG TPA: low molecular weight protein-tyrosine-phosphatase [Pelomicrobium sp.]|nr:low molecular weight protein-tyrosine-phosphatase [Pelomicrobium sp.]
MRVLLVCMGNICRSPMGEGVVRRHLVAASLHERVELESAGTHGYHVGEPPDPRAQKAAARRGYDISSLRGRRVADEDFARFDLILAMDADNLDALRRRCPPPSAFKVRLFSEFSERWRGEPVPDPYYGGPAGFEQVLDMLEDAAAGLVAYIHQQLPR